MILAIPGDVERKGFFIFFQDVMLTLHIQRAFSLIPFPAPTRAISQMNGSLNVNRAHSAALCCASITVKPFVFHVEFSCCLQQFYMVPPDTQPVTDTNRVSSQADVGGLCVGGTWRTGKGALAPPLGTEGIYRK